MRSRLPLTIGALVVVSVTVSNKANLLKSVLPKTPLSSVRKLRCCRPVAREKQ